METSTTLSPRPRGRRYLARRLAMTTLAFGLTAGALSGLGLGPASASDGPGDLQACGEQLGLPACPDDDEQPFPTLPPPDFCWDEEQGLHVCGVETGDPGEGGDPEDPQDPEDPSVPVPDAPTANPVAATPAFTG